MQAGLLSQHSISFAQEALVEVMLLLHPMQDVNYSATGHTQPCVESLCLRFLQACFHRLTALALPSSCYAVALVGGCCLVSGHCNTIQHRSKRWYSWHRAHPAPALLSRPLHSFKALDQRRTHAGDGLPSGTIGSGIMYYRITWTLDLS